MRWYQASPCLLAHRVHPLARVSAVLGTLAGLMVVLAVSARLTTTPLASASTENLEPSPAKTVAFGDSRQFPLDTLRVGFGDSHVATAVAPPVRRVAGLGTPRPNPFNPSVTVPFEMAASSRCQLVVYDAAGRSVTVLRDEFLAPGEYASVWHGEDATGRSVASGVYYVELRVGDVKDVRKLALVK